MSQGYNVSVKTVKVYSDEYIAFINADDARRIEVKTGDKILIYNPSEKIRVTSTVLITVDLAREGYILIPENLANALKVKNGDIVSISLAPYPESINYIKKKMSGEKLEKNEIYRIIKDIVDGEIGKTEILAFTLAEEYIGMDIEEIEALCRAMYETGDRIEFNRPTYDKHSIGGVPGNKVSLLIVPIVASAGLTIPKTSSRAITSPSGTADTMEVLANVTFTAEEFKEIVDKVGGALIWGGGLNLAPADDIIIRVEKVIGIDPTPQMLASILSKKLAAGIKNMVLDIPVGRETKMESMEKAEDFANRFLELSKRLGINSQVAITYGEQPVGHTVGPALEALEALEALLCKGPSSLIEKAVGLGGLILEMGGVAAYGDGYDKAMSILKSGKAYEKMKEIIEAQGGNPEIKPDEIPLGEYRYKMYAPIDGYITRISNNAINIIARAAGAPKDKGAGIMLYGKRGYKVKKGEAILEIYAERSVRLQDAVSLLNQLKPILIEGMLLKTIPSRTFYRIKY